SRPSSPVRDGITSPYDEEDLAQRPQKGNGDGWGVVSYRGNLMTRRRVSLLPAHLDSSFDISVQDAIASRPKTMLVHLLKNGKDRLPNPWNLHPFVYENWSGMLNGGLKAINKGAFNQELHDSTFPILGELPKGTTAGEAGLYLFLGRLKKQFGTLSTDEIPFEQVEKVFGQTIQDIMAKSPPEFETFSDPETGIQGTLESKPASNFVVTDGKTLLAFRHGRNLFVGRQVLPNGKSQYLISSEVLMPIPFQPPVKWLQVPEDTILSLTQTPEGKINARFKPLSQIA
ncbi:MAG: hypothetical protein K2X66_04825, partial [Cyanobacteria bacterium]|nr:hypothetical protein [Cyanobacteriota bacterium]